MENGTGQDADCVKTSNILIDANLKVRITEFALASIADMQPATFDEMVCARSGVDRELKESGSDIYSFACTVPEDHDHLYRLQRLIREGLGQGLGKPFVKFQAAAQTLQGTTAFQKEISGRASKQPCTRAEGCRPRATNPEDEGIKDSTQYRRVEMG
ncbi:uncharacterized protein EI90DRAFT_3015891 [Cantharellus anzutake]|uniref:uncharacterized protein n=1 Tax=Cantharellus anzutake TaxID=1750568 RepID=UPI001906B138|nr:uncharacterized protein EI90DRAFT_3015891 [Cantharellus anzutake]KAF8332279.1 hypothetical protein EI90DRAFT_3015891 [Cantharellus anzutake]